MRQSKTQGRQKKHEPYPIGVFSRQVIESLCKRIVHRIAIGYADMTGDIFSKMFADSIDGRDISKPKGLADVTWHRCCWSVKTVKNKAPHKAKKLRLISGRNSPGYYAGIDDPFTDIQATGKVILEVYNSRLNEAKEGHDDTRLVVLVRNMPKGEFTIFERAVVRYIPSEYSWEKNTNKNLIGKDSAGRTCFTWQRTGGQFTIHEEMPQGATKFRLRHQPPLVITMENALQLARYTPDWVEIL